MSRPCDWSRRRDRCAQRHRRFVGQQHCHALQRHCRGDRNDIGAESRDSAIGGGYDNNIAAYNSVIGGGYGNDIGLFAEWSAIGGATNNNIADLAKSSFIGGGTQQQHCRRAKSSVIGGGELNDIGTHSAQRHRRGLQQQH